MEGAAGEVVVSVLPVLATFLPIVSAVPVYLAGRYGGQLRERLSIGACAITVVLVALMYPPISRGAAVISGRGFFAFPGAFSFYVDTLGFFMALLFSFVWLVVTIYTPGYMAHGHNKNRFYAFHMVVLGGCVGTVLAGDLLGLFLFFELMSVLSYVLIIHEETPEAMSGGAKYLYMTIAGGLGLFLGVIITYHLAGTGSLHSGLLVTTPGRLATLAFIGFLVGFGMKAGMFPLHVWLPDAHPVAPAPASALLSGIMIKTGAYGLIRVYFGVFGARFAYQMRWNDILLIIAAITVLLGSAAALRQDELKRRLAYSSIAQIGYVLTGIALLGERALVGALYHIFTHAFMKGCLFLVAGAIIHETGKKMISQMDGIGRQMPVSMGCFTLAAASMVGIPPLNGFLSKWNLALGALDVSQPLIVGLLVLSSMLNAAYYFPIVMAAFFKGEHPGHKAHEAPRSMLVPIVILAVGCLIFTVLPFNWPLELARAAVRQILP